MRKIGDAVEAILKGDEALGFAFHHRLLNLTRLARFIRPLVEAHTRKEVRDTAVLMALSRLQAKNPFPVLPAEELLLDTLSVHTGLSSFTLLKSPESHRAMNRVYTEIQRKEGFVTVTEGLSEITAILEERHLKAALDTVKERPRFLYRNLASVAVKLDERVLRRPGVIYRLLQQVALLSLNVIEVTSTATEFDIYLDAEEAELALDALYHRFLKRKAPRPPPLRRR